MSSQDSNSSSASQFQEGITNALSASDSIATQSMQNLHLVHQARLSHMSRTAASLKAKYGANDPRVVAAEAAASATTSTAARISMVSQQLTTPVPLVATEGWVLHGRVFNSLLQPAANRTLFLVDGQKTYQQQYGFAYTDSTGYFQINYAPTGQPQATAQVFVEIANQDGQPVYLSTTPFQPAPGSVTYQNITLPAGEPPLGDPPPAIRTIAVPSQGKKT